MKINHDVENRINSLIKLIDDEESIYLQIREELLKIGEEVIPYLEEQSSNDRSLKSRRIEELISKLKFSVISDRLNKLKSKQNKPSLWDSLTLIALIENYIDDWTEYFEFKKKVVINFSVINSTFKSNYKKFEKFREYFFDELGFTGDSKDYYSIENMVLNRVIDRRQGIPILLSALFLSITEELNLPFYGVGMPTHFILRYKIGDIDILFDPFYNGKVVDKSECISFLIKAGFGFREDYLQNVNNREIILRVLRNMITSYSKSNQNSKVDLVTKVMEII